MLEHPRSVDYKALLKGPAGQVAEYIERHVAELSMNSVTSKGAIIQSVKGGVFLYLGFEPKMIDGGFVDVPTVSNIQLGDMSNRGHGPKIITVWENSFPNSQYFGANVVINPKFWSEMGYQRHEDMFWLKRR